MRFLRIISGVLSLVAAVSAAEFKTKVVDPQSAAIAARRSSCWTKIRPWRWSSLHPKA